jgi:hypothetical protein
MQKIQSGKMAQWPENRDHLSGPENVLGVQQWRQKNPLYWKPGKTLK